MDTETNPAPDADGILAFLPANYALRGRDALAMVSFLVFLLVPMLLSLLGVVRWFGVADRVPLGDQMHGAREWQFLGAVVAVTTLSALAGKYLWLFAMCRLLDKASVGPWIAYGYPRRVWPLDRALVNRLYRPAATSLESRLQPAKMTASLCYAISGGFVCGSLLATALSFLPLMRGDSSLWSLGGLFAGLALLYFCLGWYARRKGG